MHACAVLVRSRGILIAGPSGAGKTRLALALVREARLFGGEAWLVSDDQVLLSSAGDRLTARAPETIRGMVEIRGFGVLALPVAEACPVDLLIRLVPPDRAPRMAQDGTEDVGGCLVPRLDLPERDCAGAVLAANAFLFGSLF